MNILQQLRTAINNHGLDGIIIPRTDPYQGEYISAEYERLAFITGFTGSAGTAIVLQDKAALFVDGRYITQAKMQVSNAYDICLIPEISMAKWIAENTINQNIAFDPWLHTESQIEKLKQTCPNIEFIGINDNPIDRIWDNRPYPAIKKAWKHDEQYSGMASDDKIAQIRSTMDAFAAQQIIITDAASICWLLNIRGSDVPYTPILLGYLLITADKLILFTNPKKIDAGLSALLGLTVYDTDYINEYFQKSAPWPTLYDPNECPLKIVNLLPQKKSITNPCQILKAIKNTTEQNGMRAAHLRDGAAVTRALIRIYDHKIAINEIDIENILLAERKKEALFYDLSFPTIAGIGANGAIIHYRADAKTCRTVNSGGDLVLIDSGAQYHDGTTDITRTIWLGSGNPPEEIKKLYTLVLIGHINLAMTRFPLGTTGAQLDILARNALWQAGLDYRHGTGHGVGSFLSVHEGPCGISSRYNNIPLQHGMILSNEPGYYKEGHFGIRLENLIIVREDLPPIDGGETKMLGFETLTLVPFADDLINHQMLNHKELDWLNRYQELTKLSHKQL